MPTIKNKTDLYADIAALPTPITRVALTAVLDDMVASWEDIVQEYTTVQRNALTPFEGQKIYNTTSNRVEIYSASMWLPASQKEVIATNCGGNPNYPEGLVGDQYIVSVAGRMGGASGKTVYVGDLVYCITPNAGGNEATVGTSWQVCSSQSATDSPTFYTEITLSSAEILALNATPKVIVAAPGAGKIILPISFVASYTFVSDAYTTNISMRAGYATGVADMNLIQLDAVASYRLVTSPDCNPIENQALQVTVATGNPAAGNGTAIVGVYYKIHEL